VSRHHEYRQYRDLNVRRVIIGSAAFNKTAEYIGDFLYFLSVGLPSKKRVHLFTVKIGPLTDLDRFYHSLFEQQPNREITDMKPFLHGLPVLEDPASKLDDVRRSHC
jgi:hypothetical protein